MPTANQPAPRDRMPLRRAARVLWICAALLLGLTLALEGYVIWSIVAEWHSVQSEFGTGAALGDAFGRLTFGAITAALQLAPAIVIWLRRSTVRQGRGRLGLAALFTALAVLAMGGAAVLFLVSVFLLPEADGQAALVFLWPPLINPLLAVGVAVALPRHVAQSEPS